MARDKFFCSGIPRGFTLVELIVSLAIVALFLAAVVPSSATYYTKIQQRGAVREVVTMLNTAKYLAVIKGSSRDIEINPSKNSIALENDAFILPSGIRVSASSATELNKPGVGIIRFYPEGDSSGGTVDFYRQDGDTPYATVEVDWLLGTVSQR